jgi:hypothetical protein
LSNSRDEASTMTFPIFSPPVMECPSTLRTILIRASSSVSPAFPPAHRLPARNNMRCNNEIFRAGCVKCHAHRAH